MPRITTSRLGVITGLLAILFGLATGSRAAGRGAQAKPPIRVDADFPGGNVVVDSIVGDTVTLHQDLRDTEGNWFYWHFRVRGAAGRTLEFRFSESNPIGTRGPALSLDGGKTWSWLGTNAVKGKTFTCAFPPEAREARFCFAIPYLESNLKNFLKRHRGSGNLRAETLCKTANGRKVELLRLGRLAGGADHCVLLTCRHHACEMIANYTLEGIMDEVLGETKEGRWLREHVEFFVVPFMDKDGVEEGDQGKNRKPHDHNRDYDGESRYASVRAVRDLVTRRLNSRNVAFALDLHCPYIRGPRNESIYFVGGPDQESWGRVGEFSRVLEAVQRGPLRYRTADNLPYGQAWNTLEGPARSFGRWTAAQPNVRIGTSIEIPYANVGETTVTAENARSLGHDLARALAQQLSAAAPAKQLNVLFIVSDDLRPQLRCYGDRMVKSPNLDRLAERGLVFERAYCQQALCSQSRISLLSGRHPWTTGIYQIGPTLRSKLPEVVTLPQHFKNHGWHARSLGKVFHIGIDDPASWSEASWVSQAPRYGPEGRARVSAAAQARLAAGQQDPDKGPGRSFYAGPAFEAPDVEDDALADGDTARKAIEALRELATRPRQPFFLAVGFVNPHVPWVAPKKYFDLYNPAHINLPDNRYPPRNAPPFAAKSGDDFYWYGNVPRDRLITPEFGRQCLQGYWAAISYVDACVGRVLDELDCLGLRESTVIVFWGDHGYYMGEHNWWGGKHNNYEGATRAPLIVAAPGMKGAGRRTDALVEFVDIYPSLADLCGLPLPAGLEGKSFAPLLNEPTRHWVKVAFSEYPRGQYHGTAMRTERYRYVEWTDRGGRLVARELYDHADDPQENENVANVPQHARLLEALSTQLQTTRNAARNGATQGATKEQRRTQQPSAGHPDARPPGALQAARRQREGGAKAARLGRPSSLGHVQATEQRGMAGKLHIQPREPKISTL